MLQPGMVQPVGLQLTVGTNMRVGVVIHPSEKGQTGQHFIHRIEKKVKFYINLCDRFFSSLLILDRICFELLMITEINTDRIWYIFRKIEYCKSCRQLLYLSSDY
jgi:hypothetical protein